MSNRDRNVTTPLHFAMSSFRYIVSYYFNHNSPVGRARKVFKPYIRIQQVF